MKRLIVIAVAALAASLAGKYGVSAPRVTQ